MNWFYLLLVLDHVNGAAMVVMPEKYTAEQCWSIAQGYASIKGYCIPASGNCPKGVIFESDKIRCK